MSDLALRTVLVTGGATGLGAEYVRALHAAGANVVIADIDRSAGTALVDELGERARYLYTDVTQEHSVRQSFQAARLEFGRLDVVVNNAGTYPHEAFERIDLNAWRQVMTVNVEGVFICTKQAYLIMREARAGKVVNIASNVVWMLLPYMAHYVAAKAAVIGFTRGVAQELGVHGITINVLAPGANMPQGEPSEADLRRMRQIVSFQAIKRPQFGHDLVGAMLFLCSPASDFMTGQVICVDGGLAVP